jgi:phage-related minor tail protein
MARSRELRVQIVGDTRGFNRALDHAGRQTARFGSDAEKSSKRVTTALKGMGLAAASAGAAFGTAGLALGFKKAIDEMRDATKVSAQSAAVLKSTGGAANVTTKELERLDFPGDTCSGILARAPRRGGAAPARGGAGSEQQAARRDRLPG